MAGLSRPSSPTIEPSCPLLPPKICFTGKRGTANALPMQGEGTTLKTHPTPLLVYWVTWLLGDPETLSGDPLGQNCFHNYPKTLFVFFTVLIFQRWWWLKVNYLWEKCKSKVPWDTTSHPLGWLCSKIKDNGVLVRCREIVTLIHCWWECLM